MKASIEIKPTDGDSGNRVIQMNNSIGKSIVTLTARYRKEGLGLYAATAKACNVTLRGQYLCQAWRGL